MNDFQGLRIFFKDCYLTARQVFDDFLLEVDMTEIAARGIVMKSAIHIDEYGELSLSSLKHDWDSLPSSFTGIGFKIYQASGYRNIACVELQASPAKVMQGHNVYGTDSFFNGAVFMLEALKTAQPELAKMLDFNLVDVYRFDSTYSVQLESRDVLLACLKSLSQVSHKYLRPSSQGDYETTIYFNRNSKNPNVGRTTSLCIYSKLDEVKTQLEELKKKRTKERTPRYDHVINELSSDLLQDFAQNRLRFEGRFKTRWFEKHEIPKNLWDFIDYIEAFEKTSDIPFMQWAWQDAMKDLLAAIGDEEISVLNDHKIRDLLHQAFDTIDTAGRVRSSKARNLFRVYDSLKHNTYIQVKETMSKSSFYRAITDLQEIGLTKAQLQTLHEGSERVNMGQVIQFDFQNQTPKGYKPPSLGNLDTPQKLRAWLTGDYVQTNLTPIAKIQDLLEQHDLPPFYARALQQGREVRLSEDRVISVVLWPDGDADLISHAPDNKAAPRPWDLELEPCSIPELKKASVGRNFASFYDQFN